MLVLRLRDSVIRMGEELEKAADSEAREKENAKYYQMRMEEMKADMNELVQRELEASRRRVELVRGFRGRVGAARWWLSISDANGSVASRRWPRYQSSLAHDTILLSATLGQDWIHSRLCGAGSGTAQLPSG